LVGFRGQDSSWINQVNDFVASDNAEKEWLEQCDSLG